MGQAGELFGAGMWELVGVGHRMREHRSGIPGFLLVYRKMCLKILISYYDVTNDLVNTSMSETTNNK